jgi:hypothetical protein
LLSDNPTLVDGIQQALTQGKINTGARGIVNGYGEGVPLALISYTSDFSLLVNFLQPSLLLVAMLSEIAIVSPQFSQTFI